MTVLTDSRKTQKAVSDNAEDLGKQGKHANTVRSCRRYQFEVKVCTIKINHFEDYLHTDSS